MALRERGYLVGSAAELSALNPLIPDGTIVVERDTQLFKIGNGTAYYLSLPYASGGTGATVPGAVTGLAASTGDAQIALSWVAPANNGGVAITDYKVEYQLSTDSIWTLWTHTASTATSALITGLTNGSLYNFRVSAVNSAGTGPSASTTGTPGAITVSATNLTSNSSYSAFAQSGIQLTGVINGAPSGAAITHQWRVGIAVVATTQTFTPTIGLSGVNDLDQLQYSPIINGVEYKSSIYVVRYPIPSASGTIADRSATLGDAAQTFDASTYFSGTGIVYTISGSGASISTAGVVTLTTYVAQSATTITVSATNSGGTVTRTFSWTVANITTTAVTFTVQSIATPVDGYTTNWPRTVTMTRPTSNYQGTLFALQTENAAGTTCSVTVNGVAATQLIQRTSTSTSPSGRTICTLFWSTQTTGDADIAFMGTTGALRNVAAIHVAGGSIRTTDIDYQEIISTTGSNGTDPGVTARTFTLGNMALKNGDALITIDHTSARLSPTVPPIAEANSTQIFTTAYSGSAYTGNLAILTGTVASDQSSNYTDLVQDFSVQYNCAGLIRVRMSQYPSEKVILDEVPWDGFVQAYSGDLTTTSVTVSGMITATDQAVDVGIFDTSGNTIVDWTSAGNTSSQRFSKVLSIPAASSGTKKLVAKARLNTKQTIIGTQVNTFYCGYVFAIVGQSNTGSFLNTGWPSGDASITWPAEQYIYDNVAGSVTKPNNYGVAKLAVDWSSYCGAIPTAWVVYSVSGAASSYFKAGTDCDTNLRASMLKHGGHLHGIIIHQGEGDTATASWDDTASPANWTTNWMGLRTALVAASAGDTVATMPVFITSLLTYGDSGNAPSSDKTWSLIDKAIQDLETGQTNCWYAGSNKDANRVDGFHSYRGAAQRRGARIARKMAQVFGKATSYGHFRVTAAAKTNATTTTLTLSHGLGTDFTFVDIAHNTTGSTPPYTPNSSTRTTATSALRFEVSGDGGTTWVAATGARASATSIVLTHADIGSGTRKVRHLYGWSATNFVTAGVVIDNGLLTEPLEHFVSMDAT